MFLDNEQFDIADSVQLFNQMGPGYAQFFSVFKFVLIICVLPLMVTAVLAAIRNFGGKNCLTIDELFQIEGEFEIILDFSGGDAATGSPELWQEGPAGGDNRFADSGAFVGHGGGELIVEGYHNHQTKFQTEIKNHLNQGSVRASTGFKTTQKSHLQGKGNKFTKFFKI